MRCRSAMRRLRIRARGTSKHYLGGRGYFMPLALCISDRKRDLMNSSPSFLLVAISAAFSPVRPQQNEVYLRFSPRRSAKRASPLCSRWQRRFAGPPRARGPARERSSLQPARCALSSEIVQTHVLRLNKISLARGQRRFCAKWPMRCAASPVPPGSPGRRPRRAVLACCRAVSVARPPKKGFQPFCVSKIG